MRVPVECEPDPDVPDAGTVFVPIDIGDRVARVVLDTGSPRTTLSELPGSARPAGVAETAGLYGSATVAQWLVDQVRLGSLRAGPLLVHVIDAAPGHHPFVGLDLLGTGPWRLDLANRELVTGPPVSAGSELSVTTTGHLISEMSISGVRATALFDTGAGITMVDRRFAEAHPDLFEAADSAMATDSTGVAGAVDLARLSPYEIEGISFAGHLVAIADLPAVPDQLDAVIGYPTIAQARWSIDLPARQWQVER